MCIRDSVYACRQTGFAMLAEGNVQEVMDLSPVAHLAAIKGLSLIHICPAPRDYVGGSPLDQPESAGMAGLTRLVDPRLTLSYHAQGEVIYWKFLDLTPVGAEEIGQKFAEVSGDALEDTPFASGFAGYKDWFILEYGRPGYTVECGEGENPLPYSDIDSVYPDVRACLLYTSGLARPARRPLRSH